MIVLITGASSSAAVSEPKSGTQQQSTGSAHQQRPPVATQQPQVNRVEPNQTRAVVQKDGHENGPTAWHLPQWKNEVGIGDLISFLTLLVTAAFLNYTVKTWREMVRANNHAEKANEESSRETQESLALTRLSNEVTIRSVDVAERQVGAITRFARAQITLDRVQPPNEILPQGHPPDSVVVPLVNAGHTPAIKVQWWARAGITPKGVPIDWEFGKLRTPAEPFEGFETREATIGAGRSLNAGIPITPLSNEEIAAVIEGSYELRLHGRVQYRDIFSEQIRSTEFESLFIPLPSAHWVIVRQTEE